MAIERVDSFPRPHHFTVEEYLAFEERSEFKHEFIDGVIYDWGGPEFNESVKINNIADYPPPHRFTAEEYLVFEAESQFKHEFIDGVIYEMTGGTLNHSRIKVNMTVEFDIQLRDSNCIVCNSDMRVGADEGRYVYPDLSVVRGSARLADNNMTLLNPGLVVEVTSPSSIDYDRTRKLDYYRSLPSIQAYLVIDQHRIHLELHTRTEQGWLWQTFTDLDGVIPLDMLNVSLQLAQVYRGIEFDMA